MSSDTVLGTVVICTSLEIEYTAVREHLEGPITARAERGSLYEVGTFPANGRRWTVALTRIGLGSTQPGVQVERALAVFDPTLVLFVGVAVGRKDVVLGDVVIADAIYDYESGNDTANDYLPYIKTTVPSRRLVNRARQLARDDVWQQRILPTPLETPPKAVVTPIAAGSRVIGDENSATSQYHHRHFGDAAAVLMEGLGFLNAAYTNESVQVLVIRGISDLDSGATETADPRWQAVACRHAAAFVAELLARYTVPEGMVHRDVVRAVAVSPDGRMIVSGGADRTVRRWEVVSGGPIGGAVAGGVAAVNSVAVSPDGRMFVSGSRGTADLWETSTGRHIRNLPTTADEDINAIVFLPDGREVVAASSEGKVWRWSTEDFAPVGQPLVGDSDRFTALAVFPDGSQIVSAGVTGSIYRWNASTGAKVGAPLLGHRGEVAALAVTPDGNQIVSGGTDGTVRLWDSVTGASRGEPLFADHHVVVVAIVVTRSQIVSVDKSGRLIRWDAATGAPLNLVQLAVDDEVTAMVITPDERRVVYAAGDTVFRERFSAGLAPSSLPETSLRGVFARVVSDQETGEDALGMTEDVHRIAAMLGALDVAPPLSVALLGDWGSGKSSFMRQLRERLAVVAVQSASAGGPTVFAGHLRQVTFNAWHYSDDHLWVGLVEHMFRELAMPDEQQAPDPGKVADLKAELAGEQALQSRLETSLKDVDRVDIEGGWFGVLRAPLRTAKIVRAAAGGIRREIHDRRVWLGIVIWAIGIATITLGIVFGAAVIAWVGGAVTVAVTALAPVVVVSKKIAEYAETARKKLMREKEVIEKKVHKTTAELESLDPARRLKSLLATISGAERYESYRGLTGRIHHDLRRLDADLKEARAAFTSSAGTPPLQRIVLYVDDLDRCQPQRVVDILQAVNLLLSMELFMVVVAVDPRWLIKSLNQHHKNYFDSTDNNDLENNAIGPLDYLDKIFHIPFAIKPMGEHGPEYLRTLLPVAPELDATVDTAARPRVPTETLSAVAALNSTTQTSEPPPPVTVESSAESIAQDSAAVVSTAARSAAALLDPIIDLNPEGLQVRQIEQDFLANITPLLRTPRAVKKFANLYRLLRLSVPEQDLDQFVGGTRGGPYQAAALLLAAVVGSPREARTLLTELAGLPARGDVVEAFADIGGFPGEVAELIVELRKITPVMSDVDMYKKYAKTVARYGFETYSMFR